MNKDFKLQLKNAINDRCISKSFVIEVSDDFKLPVFLFNYDLDKINFDRNKSFLGLKAELADFGWDREPVNEKAWQKELEGIKDDELRAEREADPPKNKLEQQLNLRISSHLISDILPRYLRDENGVILFDDEDLEIFETLMNSDKSITLSLVEIYGDLIKEENERINQTVKNSQARNGKKNSDSAQQLLTDGDSARSAKKSTK